ncbi:MAG: hypothetical protein FWH41_00300 [Treponema sp.]|nr:hypothetical protein [Treponema sp.]
MKKLAVFSVFLFLAAGAAFAQLANGIYINAWGRGVFAPLWFETPEKQYGETRPNSSGIFKNGTGVTWDPINMPRVDFRVNGTTNYVGFTVHVNSEMVTGNPGNGDNGAQLWVRPFGNDWIKLTVANQFIDDTLRGKVTTDTGFENFVLGKSMMAFSNGMEPLNQDITFNRFAGGRGNMSSANAANTSTHITPEALLSNVFFLSSSPIDGLFVGLMLQGMLPKDDIKETWRQMQLGAGYVIPNIGHARVQYIGGFMGKEKNVNDMYRINEPSKFEAAFALSTVEDLTLDLGFKIWMPVSRYDDTKSYRGLDVGLGADYRFGAFNIAAMMQAMYLGAYTGTRVHTTASEEGKDGVHLIFNLIPAYDLDFGTFGLSFIWQTKTAETDAAGSKDKQTAWSRFGLGGWYKKGLPGGYIKLGVAYAFPFIRTGNPSVALPGGGYGPGDERTGLHGRGILTIPIIFEYAFF